MSLSVVYNMGSYDHELESDIPTREIAEALITNLQPYHDKSLIIKERDQVRRARLLVTNDLVYEMKIDNQ